MRRTAKMMACLRYLRAVLELKLLSCKRRVWPKPMPKRRRTLRAIKLTMLDDSIPDILKNQLRDDERAGESAAPLRLRCRSAL